VAPFIAENYPKAFGTEPGQARFLVEAMTPAKRRYAELMDVFAFRHEGAVVGVYLSDPLDWSTYYMRSALVLPEHRGGGLMTTWMSAMADELQRHGVDRLEADVSPANAPVLKMYLSLGYMVTSTTSSDRWGLTLRLTKFLREDARAIFLRQFSAMPTAG
jgi:GNAT superfamily N-acetyltransferase